jgi:hypothetical protein
MKNKKSRFAKDKYLLLSELGSKLNLSFSSHLVLGNKLVALDGIKRTLLICDLYNELNPPHIILLNAVTTVSIKKIYSNIAPGEIQLKGVEEFLRTIDLQFEYSDNNEPGVLTFYDKETNALQDIPMLERNAKNWQMILSKMVALQPNSITEASKCYH